VKEESCSFGPAVSKADSGRHIKGESRGTWETKKHASWNSIVEKQLCTTKKREGTIQMKMKQKTSVSQTTRHLRRKRNCLREKREEDRFPGAIGRKEETFETQKVLTRGARGENKKSSKRQEAGASATTKLKELGRKRKLPFLHSGSKKIGADKHFT